MVSPGGKDKQLARLQTRLNRWATADLNPNFAVPSIHPTFRGRKKLVRKYGEREISRIEREARVHQVKVWINLRKVHGLSKSTAKMIPLDLRKEVGLQKGTVLFTRRKLGVSRTKDSDKRGQLHWRASNGRFTTAPHRKRSK